MALEDARTRFEIAKQRLSSVRELASGIMTPLAYGTIIAKHPDVSYAGASLGDAIHRVLTMSIYGLYWAAYDDLPKLEKFEVPYMFLADIVKTLDEGGFEFTSAFPGREVNAALIHLAGIAKHPNWPAYKSVEADQNINQWLEARIAELEVAARKKDIAATG